MRYTSKFAVEYDLQHHYLLKMSIPRSGYHQSATGYRQ